MNPPRLDFDWNHEATASLNLATTLQSGQAFRWRRDSLGVWHGVIGQIGCALWQDPQSPRFSFFWQTFPTPNQFSPLSDYFRLDVDLDALYEAWIVADSRILEATKRFRGLRLLRQPPSECFFSFQCAACNTVTKIERSVLRLAERYGEPIMCDGGRILFAFPTLEALAGADEALLRQDPWGYRAPRVIQLAHHLLTLPPGWLASLRFVPYLEAKQALIQLHGVGEKIADCVCLFALDKDAATPVDTHIRQIACRLFSPELEGKSLTPRIYAAIADAYRERFGDYAGWAQQYLFLGELQRSQAL